jgi:hypothetical protein
LTATLFVATSAGKLDLGLNISLEACWLAWTSAFCFTVIADVGDISGAMGAAFASRHALLRHCAESRILPANPLAIARQRPLLLEKKP